MKIAIFGVDSFWGSNISNYFIQNDSRTNVLGIFLTNNYFMEVRPSIASSNRFSMQFHRHGDKSLFFRLQYENPQYILFFDSIPSEFHDRKDTVLVTSNPDAIGAYKTLLVPTVFGPRDRTGNLTQVFAGEFSDFESLSTITKSYAYIKDVFLELVDFLSSDSKFRVMSGVETNDKSIGLFLQNPDNAGLVPVELQPALLHTSKWYQANRWIFGE